MSTSTETIHAVLDYIKGGLRRSVGVPPTSAPSILPRPDGGGALFVRHEDYVVEKLDGPRRMKRQHTFADVKSFADWLKRHAKPGETEILVRDGFIDAALEPGTVDGDVVRCRLDLHPRFKRWDVLLSGPSVDQDRLHRFFLAVGEDTAKLQDKDGAILGRQADQIAGELRKLEVGISGSFKREIDERGMIRFQGADEETKVSGKLPSVFVITVPIYRGILEVYQYGDQEPSLGTPSDYQITVRLFLNVSRDKAPAFQLEAPELPVILDKATDDAVKYLGALLGPDWLVGRGELTLENVADRLAAGTLGSVSPAIAAGT